MYISRTVFSVARLCNILFCRATDREEDEKREKKERKKREDKERKKLRREEEEDGGGEWETVKGGNAIPSVIICRLFFVACVLGC